MEVRSELLTEATEATVISPDDLPNDADTWLNYNFKEDWKEENNVIKDHEDIAQDLHTVLFNYITKVKK